MSTIEQRLIEHRDALLACRRCPDMIPPVVSGHPAVSKVILVGQAPGDKEGGAGKPFAWTAGKTLFKWFQGIGLDEDTFRHRVYMAAVCRCFPGKAPKGGDRVPNPMEIENCARWMQAEITLLQPKLVLLVGKLAISQFISVDKLVDVVGKKHRIRWPTDTGPSFDAIALPHPSGASTWHRTEPGKTLLAKALGLIQRHPAWRELERAT